MAEPKSTLDRYDQFAVFYQRFSASGDDSLVSQLVTGLSNLQKVAWAVSRVEYSFRPGTHGLCSAASDHIYFGITQNSRDDQLLGLTNPAMLDMVELRRIVSTAVGFESQETWPLIHDFGNSPRLLLPQNIYACLQWVTTTPATEAYYAVARVFYKEVELGPQDWYDLLQLRLPLGAS